MQNNQNYSTTVEDLEKAASVRLFEKAAAAEGINLAELSNSQVEDLYSAYQSQSEENTMNDQLIDLFEKQAAYEGVDLESLNDEELAHVYNNFVTNLAAEEAELEGHMVADQDDAAEKLAEAEILGRHMARAYHDEVVKLASIDEAAEAGELEDLIEVDFDQISAADLATLEEEGYELVKEAGAKKILAKYVDKPIRSLGSAVGKRLKGTKVGKKMIGDMRKKSTQRLVGGLTAGTGAAAVGGGAYAAKKQMQKEAGAKALLSKADKMVQAGGAKVGKLIKKTKLGKKYAPDMRTAKGKRIMGYGTAGVSALGVGGAGYAAKKKMEKEASIGELIDERAEQFLEFGKEANWDGSSLDYAALDLLDELGYDITPVLEDYID